MSQLSAEIAVLDGLDDLYGSSIDIDPNDGRIGQAPATGTEYNKRLMPFVYGRSHVLDASEGANMSGGSSYAPGLPLLPSTVGLADAEFEAYAQSTNVLPERKNVIDPSMGANYTGGSSYAAGIPLTVSSSGLAELDDLAAAAKSLDPNDGRIGQEPAYGTEYSRWLMPHVYARGGVVDASEGANYSGGSSYAPGLPLMPSTVGLAGLGEYDDDALDGVSDEDMGLGRFGRRFRRAVGKKRVRRLKKSLKSAAKSAMRSGDPTQVARARSVMGKLRRARSVRRKLMQRAGGVVGRSAFNRGTMAASAMRIARGY